MIYHVSSFLSCIAICWRLLTCYFIIIAKTQTFVFILMVSCFCGRSSTLSVAWDESVWHKASSSNITSDGSSKDSRLRWNRIGWSDSCQIWGKLLSRLRCVTTTIDISGIERSSRLKMLWYMTRSLAPDLRNHQKYPQKLCTQSRFAHFFLDRYGIFWMISADSSCPDSSEYIWQSGVQRL